jgi:hypothetical protein
MFTIRYFKYEPEMAISDPDTLDDFVANNRSERLSQGHVIL